jgi:hypothetical protein
MREVVMLVADRIVENTDKARRNAEYLAKLDKSFSRAEAGNVYSFEMEDLEAFAAGKIDKYQLLERAK